MCGEKTALRILRIFLFCFRSVLSDTLCSSLLLIMYVGKGIFLQMQRIWLLALQLCLTVPLEQRKLPLGTERPCCEQWALSQAESSVGSKAHCWKQVAAQDMPCPALGMRHLLMLSQHPGSCLRHLYLLRSIIFAFEFFFYVVWLCVALGSKIMTYSKRKTNTNL